MPALQIISAFFINSRGFPPHRKQFAELSVYRTANELSTTYFLIDKLIPTDVLCMLETEEIRGPIKFLNLKNAN